MDGTDTRAEMGFWIALVVTLVKDSYSVSCWQARYVGRTAILWLPQDYQTHPVERSRDCACEAVLQSPILTIDVTSEEMD